jgi:transcriptional regulator with XRE-family HTH domain
MRRRRQELGMTQTTLGDSVDVTFQQVQKYERGANRISASRLYAFAKVLGVPVTYFFEDVPQDIRDQTVPDGRAAMEPELAAFVESYYRIKDPVLRHQVLGLVKATADIMKDKG